MIPKFLPNSLALLLAAALLTGGCSKAPPPAPAAANPPHHEHKPPHGGTPVVLGDEAYHLELVLDPAVGKLQAYVFDGEMENFIRSAVPSFDIDARVHGATEKLALKAVANEATGEKVGDSAVFEVEADWLKSTPEFDGVIEKITIRGTTFSGVKFNFPKGNDQD